MTGTKPWSEVFSDSWHIESMTVTPSSNNTNRVFETTMDNGVHVRQAPANQTGYRHPGPHRLVVGYFRVLKALMLSPVGLNLPGGAESWSQSVSWLVVSQLRRLRCSPVGSRQIWIEPPAKLSIIRMRLGQQGDRI